MKCYETIYLARQELSSGQVEKLTEEITKIIESFKGRIAKAEYWGLKTLAYRINKNRKAHYTLFHIECPAEAIHEMERQMRLHEDILRYMSVAIEAVEDGPSIMMLRKSEKDDRRRSDAA